MVNERSLKLMMDGKRPAYIFTHAGRLQMLSHEGRTGIIICTSRTAAKVLAEASERKGKRVSIAKVGTVTGESLARHVARSVIEEACNALFISDDGENFSPFDWRGVESD